jgi:hypothetical protein
MLVGPLMLTEVTDSMMLRFSGEETFDSRQWEGTMPLHVFPARM